jgi:hypothetical protein
MGSPLFVHRTDRDSETGGTGRPSGGHGFNTILMQSSSLLRNVL